MGTVLFLIIRPLDTAPSVTPTPPVFSRFGPLGAFTVVRFPPPTFFNFRPRRFLELSVSNNQCPSFFANLYIHIHSEDRLPPFRVDIVRFNVLRYGQSMGSGLSPHRKSLPLPPRSSSTTGTLYVSAVFPNLGHIAFFVN